MSGAILGSIHAEIRGKTRIGTCGGRGAATDTASRGAVLPATSRVVLSANWERSPAVVLRGTYEGTTKATSTAACASTCAAPLGYDPNRPAIGSCPLMDVADGAGVVYNVPTEINARRA
jgi:hypothetical protein